MAFLRSVATVSGYTLLSRLLGFLRDVLVAAVLGAGIVADAFFVALQLPNLFRRLFAEGAFNAAFVPMFSAHLAREGRQSAVDFAEQALSALLAVLVIFVGLFQIAMPLLMLVLAPGFVDEPDKFHLAVLFTRLTFPYLLLISLVSLLGGVLNSLGRFAAAAATPVLFNICLIGAVLLAAPHMPTPGHALAWGVTISGILQFLWLIEACRRAEIRFRLPRPQLTPEVRRLIGLMLPATLGAGAAQLNQVVGTVLASLLPSGSISYLFYADRLNQLPLGVIGIAFGTALLPMLARQVAAGDEAGANASQNRSIELGMLLTLPATAALLAVPYTLVGVLFQRGAFGPAETGATAAALMGYVVGLPAYVLIKMLVPGFYARQDTRTPVRIAVVAVAVNLALNLGLMWWFKHVGLALAVSLAAWLQTAMLAITLHRRGHWRADGRLWRRLPRTLLASLGMAAALLGSAEALAPVFAAGGPLRFAALAALIGIGIVVYGLLAHFLGAARLGEVLQQLSRRGTVASGNG